MYVIRDLMYCKPGKVKAIVEKSLAMAKIMEKHGQGSMRVLTDMSGEQFWTAVLEIQVKDLAQFESFMSGGGQTEAAMKEMEPLMKGYHDLVDRGRREIWKIEG